MLCRSIATLAAIAIPAATVASADLTAAPEPTTAPTAVTVTAVNPTWPVHMSRSVLHSALRPETPAAHANPRLLPDMSAWWADAMA